MSVLPTEAAAAVKKMIQMTNELMAMLDGESRSMAMNDAISFSVTEQDKSKAVEAYEKAAREFLKRVGELRQQVDGMLFDQLLDAQAQLKTIAEANNRKLEVIPGIKSANQNS